MKSFEYVNPSSLQYACAFLAAHPGEARPLAGGTDLLVLMKEGLAAPRYLVNVKHLDGLRQLTWDDVAGLTIGAAVTLSELADAPLVQQHAPILAEAAGSVGSVQVRNRATVGGNLCHAAPSADTAPALLVLEAAVRVTGPDGAREFPLADLFRGPKSTSLRSGDILTSIHVPPMPPGARGRYLKLGRRAAVDLAVVGVAALVYPDEAPLSGVRARIALGAVAPTPIRASHAEAVIAAQGLGDQAIVAAAAAAAHQDARPIDDVRSSAAYRRAMVRELTIRALRDIRPS